MEPQAPPPPGSTGTAPGELTHRFDSDAKLLDALRAGDEDAYEAMVRANIGRMLAVANRIVRNPDDAADTVQDAFVQAFRHIHDFDARSKLSTWLHQIVVNAALMKLRRDKRRNERRIDDLLPQYSDSGHRVEMGPAWTHTADDIAQNEEDRTMVRTMIDQLPDDYRTVLLLRDIEEMDTQQTADALGITPGAVKTRLHRARQALRALLEPHMTQGTGA